MGVAGQRLDLGGEQGIREAYAAHGGELYRYALRSLRDFGAAEDVVQEVFLRAWRSARTFDPDLAGLRVWLFAIARNAIVDHVRRDRRRRPTATMVEVDTGFVDSTLDRWTVEQALTRLSTDHRTAVVETYLRGRSYGEVASELRIPATTLRSRVQFGLRVLRSVMDETGVRP